MNKVPRFLFNHVASSWWLYILTGHDVSCVWKWSRVTSWWPCAHRYWSFTLSDLQGFIKGLKPHWHQLTRDTVTLNYCITVSHNNHHPILVLIGSKEGTGVGRGGCHVKCCTLCVGYSAQRCLIIQADSFIKTLSSSMHPLWLQQSYTKPSPLLSLPSSLLCVSLSQSSSLRFSLSFPIFLSFPVSTSSFVVVYALFPCSMERY